MGRKEKVATALRKEISNIIQFELKDPRIGFVTVTRVELSDDFRYLKVFLSILGTEIQEKDTMVALESASGFIRKLVSDRIKLRISPEILFRQDKNIAYSVHIQEQIEKIRKEDESRHVISNKRHKKI